MANRSETMQATDRAAAANYVATLAADLATIARRHGLDALGYILDMARLEAENAARQSNGGRHPREPSPTLPPLT
jgi:hypothetical protein